MTKTIDPMKGVVNPEQLVTELRKMKAGDRNAYSYVRGSLMVLERHPPNPVIAPLLRKAMEKYK